LNTIGSETYISSYFPTNVNIKNYTTGNRSYYRKVFDDFTEKRVTSVELASAVVGTVILGYAVVGVDRFVQLIEFDVEIGYNNIDFGNIITIPNNALFEIRTGKYSDNKSIISISNTGSYTKYIRASPPYEIISVPDTLMLVILHSNIKHWVLNKNEITKIQEDLVSLESMSINLLPDYHLQNLSTYKSNVSSSMSYDNFLITMITDTHIGTTEYEIRAPLNGLLCCDSIMRTNAVDLLVLGGDFANTKESNNTMTDLQFYNALNSAIELTSNSNSRLILRGNHELKNQISKK
jgi:hypothetical protein